MKKILLVVCLILFVFQLNEVYSQYGKWTILNPKIISLDGTNIFPYRSNHSMAQLYDKKVLLFGGKTSLINPQSNDTWLYDYELNSWIEIKTKNKPLARYDFSIAQISEGKILLYGGVHTFDRSINPDSLLEDTWIFDFADTNWHQIKTNNSPGPRGRYGLSNLTDDIVLLFGGDKTFGDDFTNDLWIFNDTIKEWFSINLNNKPLKRDGCGITKLNGGEVLIYGGWTWYKRLSDTWIYNYYLNEFRELKTFDKQSELSDQSIINLSNQYLLMYGGHENYVTNKTWLFSILDSNWLLDNLSLSPPPKYFFGMSKLMEGKGIMTGSFDYRIGIGNEYTWLYELDSNYMDVKDYQGSKDFEIFSKNDYLILDFKNIPIENAIIEIYNINGTEILSQNVPSGSSQHKIDVSNLSSGVYFLRVYSGQDVFVKKFLKY